MTTYQLSSLTRERLQEIRDSWERLAGVDEFAVELAAAFEWAAPRLSPRPGDSQAFELRRTDTGDAEALLEIIDSSSVGTTKLLTLYTSPVYWDRDADDLDELAELYAGAFLEVLAKGMEQPNWRVVKIYGRDQELLYILKHVQEKWHQADSLGRTATMQGRWLAISKR